MLDIYQKAAVETRTKNILVVAAPGSGKTTVIINRVKYLIEEMNVNPRNIIVITFTKSAANNMKQRYVNMAQSTYAPFFGTFHGLCYKILSKYLGEIKIIEDRETFKVITGVLSKYIDEVSEDKIKEFLNNISLFKYSMLEIGEFEPSMDKEIFKSVYEEYERHKALKGLWDFDDLQMQLKNLFQNNLGILNGYRKLFRHILVDEFQDCDNIQIELLRMLNQDNNIFAVGDEDQCIYSFRGSNPKCMVDFHSYFVNGKKIYLSNNYRSRKNIIEVSKNLINNNRLRNKKEINWVKNYEGEIKIVTPFNESLQGDVIAEIIKDHKYKNNENFRDHIVLYRTNDESRSVIDSFIKHKIPFYLLDKGYNFFNHFICKDIIAYLKLAIDENHRESFLRIINKPFRYISKGTLESIKGYAYEECAFDLLGRFQDLHPFQMKNMDRLKKEIGTLNKMSLNSAVDYILMDLKYIEYLRDYSSRQKTSFEEFECIVEEFRASLEGFKSIITFLVHVESVEEEVKKSRINNSEDRVILSTIHGVKGMEFSNVFVINCTEENIPHRKSSEDPNNIEEERRLFYVAITRAINNLYILAPKSLRSKFIKPSPFIEECNIKEKEEDFGYRATDKVIHSIYGAGEVKNIEGKALTIIFKDNERTFDVSVLVANNLMKKV